MPLKHIAFCAAPPERESTILRQDNHVNRSQSAMEYLMTYGWAILIIAIVLGALFQLGVFNGQNFAPKAPPGACQVFRPNGPGSTLDINLEGECQGVLPEYIGSFNSFNAFVYADLPPSFSSSSFTVSFWINPQTLGGNSGSSSTLLVSDVPLGGATNGLNWMFEFYPSGVIYFHTCYPSCGAVSSVVIGNTNTWYFVSGTYNGVSLQEYLDAVPTSSATSSMGIGLAWYVYMGNAQCGAGAGCAGGYLNGKLSNVQIYNTSLSPQEVNSLYLEGIGGAPIDVQNIVGWWPLNGNANDYSGNGNDGTAYNVIYTSSWTSGYSAP